MKYTAVSVVTLPAGATLVLTEQQAAARQHALQSVAGARGRYTSTQPIQFKAGEVFVYEGELPKAMAQAVEQLEQQRRRSKAEEKAAAAMAAKRQELQQHIAALGEAIAEAESDEAKAELQQHLGAARSELESLE